MDGQLGFTCRPWPPLRVLFSIGDWRFWINWPRKLPGKKCPRLLWGGHISLLSCWLPAHFPCSSSEVTRIRKAGREGCIKVSGCFYQWWPLLTLSNSQKMSWLKKNLQNSQRSMFVYWKRSEIYTPVNILNISLVFKACLWYWIQSQRGKLFTKMYNFFFFIETSSLIVWTLRSIRNIGHLRMHTWIGNFAEDNFAISLQSSWIFHCGLASVVLEIIYTPSVCSVM